MQHILHQILHLLFHSQMWDYLVTRTWIPAFLGLSVLIQVHCVAKKQGHHQMWMLLVWWMFGRWYNNSIFLSICIYLFFGRFQHINLVPSTRGKPLSFLSYHHHHPPSPSPSSPLSFFTICQRYQWLLLLCHCCWWWQQLKPGKMVKILTIFPGLLLLTVVSTLSPSSSTMTVNKKEVLGSSRAPQYKPFFLLPLSIIVVIVTHYHYIYHSTIVIAIFHYYHCSLLSSPLSSLPLSSLLTTVTCYYQCYSYLLLLMLYCYLLLFIFANVKSY